MILWTFPFAPGSFTENFKLLSRPGGRNPIHGSLQRARHAALLDTAPNFPCCLWNHNKPELRMSGTFLNTVHVISYNHSQWLYGAGTGISSGDGNWGREVKALPDSAVARLVYHPKQSGYHAATLRFEEHSKDGSQLRARCLAKAASWYSVEFISVQGLLLHGGPPEPLRHHTLTMSITQPDYFLTDYLAPIWPPAGMVPRAEFTYRQPAARKLSVEQMTTFWQS